MIRGRLSRKMNLPAETGDLFGLHRRFRVVTEPHFGDFTQAHLGVMWFRLKIEGKSAFTRGVFISLSGFTGLGSR